MINVLATKIGMTQIFQEDGKLVPVTVIDVSDVVIIRRKTIQSDGYDALVVGLLRERYKSKTFSADWLKNTSRHFHHIQEIASQTNHEANIYFSFNDLQPGQLFDVSGITKGKGFQGVVKRHGFRGGRASHGSCLGRIPGSIGNHRSQGKVMKGKKLPGHMGCIRRTIAGIQVIKTDLSGKIVFIKGSVPGHAGSVISLTKSMETL